MNLHERTMKAQQLFNEWNPPDFDGVPRGVPFAWGSRDCAHMAARMVEIMTGNNPIADWPTYASEQQAFKAIRAKGFKSLQDAVSGYATPLEGPLFAIVGDIVAIKAKTSRMPALGVCLGSDAVLCFGPDVDENGVAIPETSHVRRVDMQYAEAAWRII